MLCWYGSHSLKAKTALVKIVNISSKILEVQQSHPTDLYNPQVVRKAQSILMVTLHPLYPEFQFLPSGSRLRFPSVRSNRYKHSFIPTSTSLLNSGMRGVGGSS